MKKKEYKWTNKEKELVKKYVEFLKPKFNLHGWSFYYEFNDGDGEAKNGLIIDAHCAVTFPYEKTVISFESPLLKMIREKRIYDVRSSIKHEVAHSIVEELWDLAIERYTTKDQIENAAERLTQRISMLVDENK